MIWHLIAYPTLIGAAYYIGWRVGCARPFRARFQDHHIEKAVLKMRELL